MFRTRSGCVVPYLYFPLYIRGASLHPVNSYLYCITYVIYLPLVKFFPCIYTGWPPVPRKAEQNTNSSPEAATPKAGTAPGTGAAPKPGDPIWAGLPKPPGVAGVPNAPAGDAGAPKPVPGDAGAPNAPPGAAGVPKAAPGDPNEPPNGAAGVEGLPKPAEMTVLSTTTPPDAYHTQPCY